MNSVAELATIPLKFPRKERIVIDVQISNGKYIRVLLEYISILIHNFEPPKYKCQNLHISSICETGWMHAGYPIMGHTPTASDMTIVKKIFNGSLWGPIHELGHNQQRNCWEFPPHTTESTCNLWSVYVHEEVLGINRAKVRYCFRPLTVSGSS